MNETREQLRNLFHIYQRRAKEAPKNSTERQLYRQVCQDIDEILTEYTSYRIPQNSSTEHTDEKNSSGLTREELDKKVQQHKEKRKDAYVKMGNVDIPPEERS
jgi:hypothetical protein